MVGRRVQQFLGLKHQIAGGLNYALSGLPYWTTEIRGYWPTSDYPLDSTAYQELYLRWFQFGAFCPVFRSHGHRPHNEMWTYDKVEPALLDFDRLRYRLMPYIYSLASMVTREDYTMQRPLVMDFRDDHRTHNIRDQFMFGPAIMVNPVTEPRSSAQSICQIKVLGITSGLANVLEVVFLWMPRPPWRDCHRI